MKKLWRRIASPVLTFIDLFKSAEMTLSSIAVAYYLLLSLFPLLLIVGNALPYLHINANSVLAFLSAHVPEQIYDAISGVVKSLLTQPNTSLLSLSVIVGLWTFSRALSMLQMAMNKAYGVYAHRDFIVSRILGLLSGLVVLLILYFSVILATVGVQILKAMQRVVHMNLALYDALNHIGLPAAALASILALMFLYFILPNVRIKKIRYVLPGTLFSTFVLVFLTNLFAIYLTEALRGLHDFKIVGTIAIFALMIWFIFIARVLILGAVMNATYQRRRTGKIETRRGEIVEIIQAVRERQEEKKKKNQA
ncbi:MAG: YihY/virulence factor BrkB family protein [Streptococcaceae bacterium]|jgi:membrane protein|nr:YihY/virulence factor BrkB family protein [Streptococcaceae bacterium]